LRAKRKNCLTQRRRGAEKRGSKEGNFFLLCDSAPLREIILLFEFEIVSFSKSARSLLVGFYSFYIVLFFGASPGLIFRGVSGGSWRIEDR
jgi:hypothetical protein